jgi:ATP-binding cassette, subfamily A (ABC1), member 3
MVAVSNLNFGLNSGECFALLGVNGAGKSTTFKSLTHEVLPTGGQIKIGGYDLNKDFEKARKLIGYCPQPNLVFDTMTVEEHIYYYSMIKGIPRNKRTFLVEQAI